MKEKLLKNSSREKTSKLTEPPNDSLEKNLDLVQTDLNMSRLCSYPKNSSVV